MEENTRTGTCMQMCPKQERHLRENNFLLHRLEMVESTINTRKPRADPKKIVKEFTRSAAGKDSQTPEMLRPPEVLLCTVSYLLGDVISNKYYSWNEIFDFVSDRLRSVRQDMVIQSVPKGPAISILQPIVRFHAYSSYRLCGESVNIFDPMINKTQFQECVKRLLGFYDECEFFKGRCEDLGLSMCNYDDIYANCRPAIEALYILLNLGDTEVIMRGVRLDDKWRTPDLKLSLSISLNYWRGNWVKVCRLIQKLPTLLIAVASLHLPEIRRKALQAMSTAYNNQILWYPIAHLKDTLLYSNRKDLIKDLAHYNILIDDRQQNVQFIKVNFDKNKKTIGPRYEDFVEDKLYERSVIDMILYGDI